MKKFLLYFISSIVLLLLFLSFLAVSFTPTVADNSAKQVGNADTINPLLRQTKNVLNQRFTSHQVKIDKAQVESLAGFITRSHAPVSAQVNMQTDQLTLQTSYRISSDIFFNISVWVESGTGVNLNGVKIGQVYLPGNLGLHIAELFTDFFTGSDIATQAIASVRSINISENDVQVALNPLDKALKEVKNVDLGGGSEKQDEKVRIAKYLTFLSKIPSDTQRSLNYYIHEVMTEAKMLSNNKPYRAVEENQAAILALAIFAGDRRFSSAVGNMSFAISHIPTATRKPVLLGRSDLNLHFIYSAAIKLLSEQDFSFAVGEFKELMDRAQGGSGYSFVDLAADMAGVHFALVASDPSTALNFQDILIIANDEAAFMPPIDGLEEGLSKDEFVRKYGSVDSQSYRQKLSSIQSRIDALAISNLM